MSTLTEVILPLAVTGAGTLLPIIKFSHSYLERKFSKMNTSIKQIDINLDVAVAQLETKIESETARLEKKIDVSPKK